MALKDHPQDGRPAGRLSSSTDRPLPHAAGQLFSKPLSYSRWSIVEAEVCPRHTHSAELGLNMLCEASSRLGLGVPRGSSDWKPYPGSLFSIPLPDSRGEPRLLALAMAATIMATVPLQSGLENSTPPHETPSLHSVPTGADGCVMAKKTR